MMRPAAQPQSSPWLSRVMEPLRKKLAQGASDGGFPLRAGRGDGCAFLGQALIP